MLFRSILHYFALVLMDFDGLLMDFGWILMDFGWVLMDFGWILVDFGWLCTGGAKNCNCSYLHFSFVADDSRNHSWQEPRNLS